MGNDERKWCAIFHITGTVLCVGGLAVGFPLLTWMTLLVMLAINASVLVLARTE